MKLTDEEKRALDGGLGEGKRIAMEILTRTGRIFGADRMIPVRSAHVLSSLLNFHNAGIEVIEKLASYGDRYAIPTTVDPMSTSVEGHEMTVPQELRDRQARICRAHEALGVIPSWTCTPYWGENVPAYGEHVAWSESSAVAFVNSVLGARTNRLSTGLEMAAAIMGRIPEYGLHLTENRRPGVRFVVTGDHRGEIGFGGVGYLVGKLSRGKVPYIDGLRPDATPEDLTCLGASAASVGGVALFHAAGVTAEAKRGQVDTSALGGCDEHVVDDAALRDVVEHLCTTTRDPDLVVLGCPHYSLNRLKAVASLLRGKRIRESVRLWVYTSPHVKRLASEQGVVEVIEGSGARIVTGTCMVISFLEYAGVNVMMTNSVRAARLVPSEHGCDAILAPLEECIACATGGGVR